MNTFYSHFFADIFQILIESDPETRQQSNDQKIPQKPITDQRQEKISPTDYPTFILNTFYK